MSHKAVIFQQKSGLAGFKFSNPAGTGFGRILKKLPEPESGAALVIMTQKS